MVGLQTESAITSLQKSLSGARSFWIDSLPPLEMFRVHTPLFASVPAAFHRSQGFSSPFVLVLVRFMFRKLLVIKSDPLSPFKVLTRDPMQRWHGVGCP